MADALILIVEDNDNKQEAAARRAAPSRATGIAEASRRSGATALAFELLPALISWTSSCQA